MKTIEAICRGHIFRSYSTEFFGNLYIAKLGIEDALSITSTGLEVDRMPDELTLDQAFHYVRMAEQRGFFHYLPDGDVAMLQGAFEEEDKLNDQPHYIQQFAINAIKWLEETELLLTSMAFQSLGYVSDHKRTRTYAREDVDFILAMNDKDIQAIRERYRDGPRLLVKDFMKYAGMRKQMPNVFGEPDPEKYSYVLTHYIKPGIEHSIDRFIKENKL